MALKGLKDYFKILGISRNATEKEIKTAFRKLARKFHPDLHPHDEKAESQFKEINEAYEILSDKKKKKSYEQYLSFWSKNSDEKSKDFYRGNNEKNFDQYLNFDDFLTDLIEFIVQQKKLNNRCWKKLINYKMYLQMLIIQKQQLP